MVTNVMGKSFRGNMRVKDGLVQKFFGVGHQTAQQVCSRLGFYPEMRMHQLDEPRILALTKELSGLKIETELRNEVLGNIKRKIDIGHYQGMRHAQGLPVHALGAKTGIAGLRVSITQFTSSTNITDIGGQGSEGSGPMNEAIGFVCRGGRLHVEDTLPGDAYLEARVSAQDLVSLIDYVRAWLALKGSRYPRN